MRCAVVVEHSRVADVAMYPVLSRMSTKQSMTPRNLKCQLNSARKSYGVCTGSSPSGLPHSHRRLFSGADWPKRPTGKKGFLRTFGGVERAFVVCGIGRDFQSWFRFSCPHLMVIRPCTCQRRGSAAPRMLDRAPQGALSLGLPTRG